MHVGAWIRFYGQWIASCPSVVLVLVVPCQTFVGGYSSWAWLRLSLRGPGARVFSAMEIPQLLYFLGGRCPCSVLSRSGRGDSTSTVLRSVDDVPVVAQ